MDRLPIFGSRFLFPRLQYSGAIADALATTNNADRSVGPLYKYPGALCVASVQDGSAIRRA